MQFGLGMLYEATRENYKHRVHEDELQGLIFDCDGTLVDTMPAYYESWKRLCKNNDLILSEEQFYKYAGVPVPDIIREVVAASGKTGQLDEAALLKEKASYGFDAMKSVGQPAIECVVDIVKKYHGKKPMAVASSGIRSHVLESLTVNGLLEYFDVIVTAEDVINSKPAPDIFLLAAKKIQCDPKFCRGFEDGGVGLQALKAAGMEVIDVKLMSGYPRRGSDSDEDDNRAPPTPEKDDGWIFSIVGALAALFIALKIGQFLLVEAIVDEALSSD